MKMRKSILAGAAALAVCATSAPAMAQWTVIDPSNLAQAVQQVKQLTQQIQMMQQQYKTMMQQYQAIAHLPQSALNQLQSQLTVPQFRNPLSAGSADVGSIMNGSGLGSGALGSDLQTYLNQNRVYSPTGQDFQAQQMNRNATSVAGSQAMAADLYQSAASHIQTLQGLEGQLASAPDEKAVADIQARIGMEQAAFQAQQVQAQSLAMWQQAQERNQDERNDEARRQQIDNLIDQAKAHGG
jgi:type IV secretion system protein VirB5